MQLQKRHILMCDNCTVHADDFRLFLLFRKIHTYIFIIWRHKIKTGLYITALSNDNGMYVVCVLYLYIFYSFYLTFCIATINDAVIQMRVAETCITMNVALLHKPPNYILNRQSKGHPNKWSRLHIQTYIISIFIPLYILTIVLKY